MRVVLDEDVDRGQVHRRRRHSRALLIARSLSARRVFFRLHGPARLRRPCAPLCLACCFCPRCQSIFQVAMAAGFHLFPFRTEKLSPPAPMVLHTRGRVGSRRFFPGEGSLCDCAGALPCFWGTGRPFRDPTGGQARPSHVTSRKKWCAVCARGKAWKNLRLKPLSTVGIAFLFPSDCSGGSVSGVYFCVIWKKE